MRRVRRLTRAAGAALGILAGGCGGGGESLPAPPTAPAAEAALRARGYLDNALGLMERTAYNRRRVDWPAVRATAQAMAADATTPAATHPAIRYALSALGDGHSFLQPPAAGAGAGGPAPPADSPDGRVVGDRFGYLRVPAFNPPFGTPGYEALLSGMADTLQALVRAVDGRDSCGWVVDLRHNTGGNMWPMLAGVAPVLGDGPYGAFVDADGNATRWQYADGAAGVVFAGGPFQAQARTGRAPYAVRRPGAPVAVLTDSLTASSGEAIAVAFRGRPATRSFGGATYGVPTSNSTSRLADGAILLVMTALDADRTGRPYDGPIAPDVAVPQTGRPATDDATVLAATSWLATQPTCAAVP